MESNSNSESEHDAASKSSRGPTIKPKAGRGRIVVNYNKRGVPVGPEATKLTSFEGMIGRTMVPITYGSWKDVDEEKKEELWQYVLQHFILDPKSRKQTLQSIGKKWKNFKHYLYETYIKPQKNEPEAKKKLLKPPDKYPFLKKEDWKLFVSQRTTKDWEEKSAKGKEVRARHVYNHHMSRKGYAGLLVEITLQTGKAEEEIDRAVLWKKGRELKTGGFDPNVQPIVDKIDKLQSSESCLGEICGTNDVLSQALGTEEQSGRVRGMGKFVTPQQYFFLPKTVKQFMDIEKRNTDKRFNKIEEELEKMKKQKGLNSTLNSEAASCQTGDNEEFEATPFEEPLDTLCYLAVDVRSNIVAKGTIMTETGENAEVMMDIVLQGQAKLPIPIEDEFIVDVSDAVGHIINWPRHLVIRCSELEKVMGKPTQKHAKIIKTKKNNKEQNRPREPDDQENKKEKEIEK